MVTQLAINSTVQIYSHRWKIWKLGLATGRKECDYLIIFPEKENRKNGEEEIFEEIKTENFLELMKSIKTKQAKQKPYLNTTYLKTAKEKCSKGAEIKLKIKISNSESQ